MKKIISFILVCVLMVSLCACSSTPTLVSSGDNKGSGQSESSNEMTFNVGDTVKLDNVEVTFVGVTESKGSDFFKPADGKVFVLCEFEISNKSDAELSVSSMLSFEAYCDDYACELSISALADKSDKTQLDGTVAPGKKMKGVVGYEISSNWAELEIRYTPDILSNDKMVFIAKNS